MTDFEKGPENSKIINIKRVKEDPRSLLNLGVLFHEKDDFRNAIDCFTKAIQVDPQYSMAWLNLGNVYSDLKRREKAIECYEKAIKFDPNSADAYYNLALLQEASNPFSAISNYNKYLEHNDKGDSENAEVVAKITKLKEKIKRKS